jgi:hypothetical protein
MTLLLEDPVKIAGAEDFSVARTLKRASRTEVRATRPGGRGQYREEGWLRATVFKPNGNKATRNQTGTLTNVP